MTESTIDSWVGAVRTWFGSTAWLAAAVAAEASAQVEDDVINKKEGELDEQYAAIKIDYEIEVVGEE